MNFCSHCGAAVTLAVPAGDHLPRHVCAACGAIHYRNPKIVAGCVVEWEGAILLCRRAIEPGHGKWTLPAGFMELDESTAEAAAREAMEEAGVRVALDALFSLVDIPRIGQVHLFYRGRLLSPALDPGPESLDATLFAEADLPWAEIAFSSVGNSLSRYLEDRRRGRFSMHSITL